MKVKLNRRLGQNKAGTVLDLTQQEAEWLVTQRHGELVDDSKQDSPEEDDLSSVKLADLKAKAESMGVASYGTKREIAERIAAAENEQGNEDDEQE